MAIINIGLKKGLAANIDYNQRYNAYLADRQLAMQEERLNMEQFKIMQEMFKPFSGNLTQAGNQRYNQVVERVSKAAGDLHVKYNGDIWTNPDAAIEISKLQRELVASDVLVEENAYNRELASFYDYMEKNPHMTSTPFVRDYMDAASAWAKDINRKEVPKFIPEYEEPVQEVIQNRYQNLFVPVYNSQSKATELRMDEGRLEMAVADMSQIGSGVFNQLAGRFKNTNPGTEELTSVELVEHKDWKPFVRNQLILGVKLNKSIGDYVKYAPTESKTDPYKNRISPETVSMSTSLISGTELYNFPSSQVFGSKTPGIGYIASGNYVKSMKFKGFGGDIPKSWQSLSIGLYPNGNIQRDVQNDLSKLKSSGKAYISESDYKALSSDLAVLNKKLVEAQSEENPNQTIIANLKNQIASQQKSLGYLSRTVLTDSSREQWGIDKGSSLSVIYTFEYENYTTIDDGVANKLAQLVSDEAFPGTSGDARVNRNNSYNYIKNALSTTQDNQTNSTSQAPASSVTRNPNAPR